MLERYFPVQLAIEMLVPTPYQGCQHGVTCLYNSCRHWVSLAGKTRRLKQLEPYAAVEVRRGGSAAEVRREVSTLVMPHTS